ncbi:hypothetical protein GQ55_2G381400 [Panicum hallii var. hallii]|uniref:Uncharacterized protein n=1 Tax=Panicum hallii var. hallii TaxID=1504633 RepID=A0A2T7EWS4_9POAL|nr:hypothetical protein GQ55_2G381400 [Panicum hallii var. hallii]
MTCVSASIFVSKIGDKFGGKGTFIRIAHLVVNSMLLPWTVSRRAMSASSRPCDD